MCYVPGPVLKLYLCHPPPIHLLNSTLDVVVIITQLRDEEPEAQVAEVPATAHTANKWKSWDLNPHHLNPEPCILCLLCVCRYGRIWTETSFNCRWIVWRNEAFPLQPPGSCSGFSFRGIHRRKTYFLANSK